MLIIQIVSLFFVDPSKKLANFIDVFQEPFFLLHFLTLYFSFSINFSIFSEMHKRQRNTDPLPQMSVTPKAEP